MAGDYVLYTTASGKQIKGSTIRSIVSIYRANLKKKLKGSTAKDINKLLEKHLLIGGEYWVKVFLPLRYDPGYARSALGYRAQTKYNKFKIRAAASGDVRGPQPTPFMLTGASRDKIMSSVRVSALAQGNRGWIKVNFDFTQEMQMSQGGGLGKKFTFLPTTEYARVMEVVNRSLAAELNNTTPPDQAVEDPQRNPNIPEARHG